MVTFDLTLCPGVVVRLSVHERNLLFCARPRHIGTAANESELVRAALSHPIGSAPLSERLRPCDRVVIIVDDATRPTPTRRLLPLVLDELERAGVPPHGVRIFIALGTHRPMTEGELVLKLGRRVLEQYEVINRHYLDGEFVSLGETANGIPVEIDRRVVEADFRIAIGNVVPHMASGWGGGSKAVLPGVCSRRTTDAMHLMACTVQSVLEVLGQRDNRPRLEMDAVATKAGLDFILNTVLDEEGRVIGAFAGDFVAAHRAAVAFAEQVLVVSIPRPADILVVSAVPSHMSYWQAIKPYVYAQRAVREGGVIVFLLDAREGLCGDAPAHESVVRQYIQLPFEEQKAAAERGEVQDLAGLNVPMYHAMVRERAQRTICVTPHLPASDLALLGFDSAPDVDTALAEAFRIMGCDATVGIIPFGGETLTRVE